MSVTFKCSNCGAIDSRSDSTLGQKTVCETCHHPGVVGRHKQSTRGEPWYGSFSRSCATFGLIVGILGFVASLFLAMFAALATALTVASQSLSLVFLSALVLLFNDACRDIRKIRESSASTD